MPRNNWRGQSQTDSPKKGRSLFRIGLSARFCAQFSGGGALGWTCASLHATVSVLAGRGPQKTPASGKRCEAAIVIAEGLAQGRPWYGSPQQRRSHGGSGDRPSDRGGSAVRCWGRAPAAGCGDLADAIAARAPPGELKAFLDGTKKARPGCWAALHLLHPAVAQVKKAENPGQDGAQFLLVGPIVNAGRQSRGRQRDRAGRALR